ncbi:uncharacterized protein N7443_003884 [Penicillium atrosanguineum]|uniref:uncharacterized protein n=1 Tax=Penicillium atrosanguineum TaxID=1132637 RepID=UPI00238F59BE|nr:uncharacterized protein N7443_003884 [Penicillium atrosanguineum]KAJ5304224.1 hypothetical protein N7443_003884 [Penicillium atrosanguineum]
MPKENDPDDKKNQNPPKMPHDRDWTDESNPFVAFRRFADEQVSSVLQSITGLPSSVTPPQHDRWTIFTDDKGYGSMKYRHRDGAENAGDRNYPSDQGAGTNPPSSGDKDEPSSDNNEKSVTRPSQFRQPEKDQNQQPRGNMRNGPSDFFGIDSFFDRFEHDFLPFSSSLFHPHQRFSFPDLYEENSPTWPMAYVMFSPYSPLLLEHQAHYRARREGGVFSSIMSTLRSDSERDPTEPQWREAFEDLLRLENGKPMLDYDALTAGKAENGTEWLHGLVKRGSLGDRWKYVTGSDSHPWTGIKFDTGRNGDSPALSERAAEPRQNGEQAESELDVYERFLQNIEARERESFRGVPESPLLRLLLDERQREQDAPENYQRGLPSAEDKQGDDDNESWLDLVSGGNRKSVPETPPEPTSTSEGKPVALPEARVVSTMSRTERKRLADGSVQTTIVKTKRYADGREETDESVETTHLRSGERQSAEDNKSKGGWFWKD